MMTTGLFSKLWRRCLWISILVGAGACDINIDMCDKEETRCEGNTVQICTYKTNLRDYQGYYLETIDCEDNTDGNNLCMEYTNSRYKKRDARCFASMNPCPPDADSLCLDNTTLAICSHSLPFVWQKCKHHCVYTATGNADCAYIDTQCSPGVRRCFVENVEKTNQWVVCNSDGIYSDLYNCPPDERCEQVSSSEIICVPE
jgi:hypothetical protein